MTDAATREQIAALIALSVDAVVCLSRAGDVTWASGSCQTVLGATPETLAGRPIADLIAPADREPWAAAIAELIARPDAPVRLRCRWMSPSGWCPTIDIVARRLPGEAQVNGFLLQCRDATAWTASDVALQAAREAVIEAQAKYRPLVEQSLVAVFILRGERLVYANPKGAEMMGYPVDELIALPSAFDLLVEGDREFVRGELDRIETEGKRSAQFVARARRRDGDIVKGEAFCTRTEFEGQPALVATVVDISDRVRLEDQLRQAQKMEAIGRLAGGIAHDFNNLLTAIRGNAELLGFRLADTPAQAEVDEILHAADRAASLTQHLLAFSRKQTFQPVRLDLNDIVEPIARMARRIIGTEARLEVKTDRTLADVLADPAQIEQVLLNLIINARDALPQGGRIRVTTETVALDEQASEAVAAGLPGGRYVRLTVDDDGIGMDPAIQARIFEPFFTTKEPGRGTGLGLSTVYGIVRQSGGTVTVTSARNEGATFRIYLPALSDTEPGAATRGQTRLTIHRSDDA